MAYQITRISTIHSTAFSGWQQRRHHSSTLLVLCKWNPKVTDGFPIQMASNVESISLSSCIYHDVTRHLCIKSETSNSLTHQEEQFNSSSPSAAYMHQWTGSALVQVMACRQFGAKPLPEPMLAVNWTPGNKLQWNSTWNSIIFFQENSFEIVICQNGSHFVQGGDELKICLYIEQDPEPCLNIR